MRWGCEGRVEWSWRWRVEWKVISKSWQQGNKEIEGIEEGSIVSGWTGLNEKTGKIE